MHGDAPKSPVTGVTGWETYPEQLALLHYAEQVPSRGLILEIGGEFGMSASLFSKAAKKDVTIITVDLFPDNLLELHTENLTEAGYKGRTIPIASDSATFAETWPERGSFMAEPAEGKPYPEIDLLFIDGDHSFNGAKRDIDGWIKYVKVGGVVIFHDATPPSNLNPHPLHHEVDRAINQWVSQTSQSGEKWTELDYVDTMRVFKLESRSEPETPAKPASKTTTKKK